MKIYCDASNMHTGGGKTLILDFISSARHFKNTKFVIFIDKRLVFKETAAKNIQFIIINKFLRLFISFYLFFKIQTEDCIIYLGNIPPIFSNKCSSILYLGNRYIIDWVSTYQFKLKSRIRINIERVLFYLFHKNVDKIFVQSESMKIILEKNVRKISKCHIFPFLSTFLIESNNIKKEKFDFIYIASDEPHKNHINLLQAWVILSKNNCFPSLCLVLPKESFLIKIINKIKNENPSIDIAIKQDLSRIKITSILKSSRSLIFPSYFESFGLPIVEAMICGIDIVASEKDFVRDLVDPSETFDPSSPHSIARAVRRHLSIKDLKTQLKTTDDFINFILKKESYFETI